MFINEIRPSSVAFSAVISAGLRELRRDGRTFVAAAATATTVAAVAAAVT